MCDTCLSAQHPPPPPPTAPTMNFTGFIHCMWLTCIGANVVTDESLICLYKKNVIADVNVIATWEWISKKLKPNLENVEPVCWQDIVLVLPITLIDRMGKIFSQQLCFCFAVGQRLSLKIQIKHCICEPLQKLEACLNEDAITIGLEMLKYLLSDLERKALLGLDGSG